MKQNASKFSKGIILAWVLAMGVAVVAFVALWLATHLNLLETWGFARQTKQEIAPEISRYRTSGSRVMVGDSNGFGLARRKHRGVRGTGNERVPCFQKRGRYRATIWCLEFRFREFQPSRQK